MILAPAEEQQLFMNLLNQKTMSRILITTILLFCSLVISAQTLNEANYSRLLKSNVEEFISYAKSENFTTSIDSQVHMAFATKKGFVYGKPIDNSNDNDYYQLVLLISTLNKENNKLILKNAVENTDKKGIWTDDQYLYREWDLENPESKEMWYKVIIYKKK